MYPAKAQRQTEEILVRGGRRRSGGNLDRGEFHLTKFAQVQQLTVDGRQEKDIHPFRFRVAFGGQSGEGDPAA